MSVKENYTCCPEKPENGEMTKIERNECDQLMNACSHDELLKDEGQIQILPHKSDKGSPGLQKNLNSPVNSYLNKSMNIPSNLASSSKNQESKGLEEQLLIKKALSSSFSETVRRREILKSELKTHAVSGQDLDFDEANFKDLLNTKSNVARTITYHDKHRIKHELKQKILEGKKVYIKGEIKHFF